MAGQTPSQSKNGRSKAGRQWQYLVITDIDNTLFDFGLYVEAGLDAVVREARSALNLSADEAAAELRSAFRELNSIEVSFAYEMLPAIRRLAESDRHAPSQRLAAAFWRGAAPRLKPYPGVMSTMAHLRENDVAVVAVTDAPMWEVWRKLRHLGLLRYMAGVVAVGALYRRREPVLARRDIPELVQPTSSRTRFTRLLGSAERKPSPLAYQGVLDELNMPPSRVTVIGDSPTKDLDPARELGLYAVWARYGERHRDMERVLQSVTPFEPPEAVERQDVAADSYPKLDSFGELEGHIKLNRNQLRFPFPERP